MDTNTLLVIGAGASSSYGLPLGRGLVENVATTVRNLPVPKDSMARFVTDVAADRDRHLLSIAQRLKRSRAPTIDAFIRDQKDRRLLVEAMADAIWAAEDRSLMHDQNRDDDWIAWLYHSRLHRRPADFPKNQLAFASFNYDRLPKAIMAAMMAHLFDENLEACLGQVGSEVAGAGERFWYVHGALSAPLAGGPGTGTNDDRRIRSHHRGRLLPNQVCADIVTLYDKEPEAGIASRFRSLIQWADRIVFLGIGYHQEMLDRLNAGFPGGAKEWVPQKAFVGGTAFGLERPMRKRIETWAGPSFVLGEPDQNCTAFLAEHLS
jgi:hypothetical protein